MQITKSIRRVIASVFLTAGLAYPACAAVCPKGIGGCISPGKCFLFTDADGNALCDYTARTGSQSTLNPLSSGTNAPIQPQSTITTPTILTPDPTTTQVSQIPASSTVITSGIPKSDVATSVIQNTSSGGFLDSIQLSVPITEAILFFLFTGIIFFLIRSGILGIHEKRKLPALALSSIFGLGLSLITTSFLAGGTIAGTTLAVWYIVTGTLISAYLRRLGVMTKQNVLLIAGLSTVTGFVFMAPIMPLELGGIVNVITGISVLNLGIMVICVIIAMSLVLGRIFCSAICPVGSLQELIYTVPVKKWVLPRTIIPELIRLAVFVATVIAAIYFIDLMAFTGLYDLFSLTFSAGLIVAVVIVVLSLFIYRPVCRIICPFGVLFSFLAEFSWFRLQRTGACINCRKCEKVCPVKVAESQESKGECYLCGRCTSICPVEGALKYQK